MYVKRVSDLVACFGQSEQYATTEGPARQSRDGSLLLLCRIPTDPQPTKHIPGHIVKTLLHFYN